VTKGRRRLIIPHIQSRVDWVFSMFFGLIGTDALAQRMLNGATVRDQGWPNNDHNDNAVKHKP
jgi:hypothetical protein